MLKNINKVYKIIFFIFFKKILKLDFKIVNYYLIEIVNKYNNVTTSIGFFIYGGLIIHILSFICLLVLPDRIELPLLVSKTNVITIRPRERLFVVEVGFEPTLPMVI